MVAPPKGIGDPGESRTGNRPGTQGPPGVWRGCPSTAGVASKWGEQGSPQRGATHGPASGQQRQQADGRSWSPGDIWGRPLCLVAPVGEDGRPWWQETEVCGRRDGHEDALMTAL